MASLRVVLRDLDVVQRPEVLTPVKLTFGELHVGLGESQLARSALVGSVFACLVQARPNPSARAAKS